MTEDEKSTTGANDRPKTDSIAQTAPGIPDDSAMPVDASDQQLEAVRAALGVGAPDQGEADQRPAQRKDHQQDDQNPKGGPVEGAEEIEGAEADEDTYD